jgi:hypothetical protein
MLLKVLSIQNQAFSSSHQCGGVALIFFEEVMVMSAVREEGEPRLLPVTITEQGEQLIGYPSEKQGRVTDETEDSEVGTSVHGICRGFTDRERVSFTHSIIRCRKCGLRVYIPEGVTTYRQLREHFAQFNQSQ